MSSPKVIEHQSFRPTRFHLSPTKDIPLAFFRKAYPKNLFTIDFKQWESLSNEELQVHLRIFRTQKYVQVLRIPTYCYNNKYFCNSLKHLWSNCGHIDAQFEQNSFKKRYCQRFSKRIKSLSLDSLEYNLKPMKTFRYLKTLHINFHLEAQTISTVYFQKLAKILSRLSRLETCFLLSIRSNESNIKGINQLVLQSKTPTKFIAEFNDVPLSHLASLSALKDRLKVQAKISAIDNAITSDSDFSFLQKIEISLRFGLNITDVSHMNFLHYMNNLHILTLSFRFKDLPTTSITDLFRIIKLPKQLTFLSLELNDLQLNHKPFKKTPQNLLKCLDYIEEALDDLKTEISTKNLIGEFEGLKRLQSLKLLFSGEQDNPLFHLLTYAAVRCLPNLNDINVIIELSRSYNFMNQIYYELNFTYLLTLLQHPEKLQQVLISVPIIAFRKVPQLPKLPSIEKVFLHYSKDPGDLEEYEEYAERVFEAISETHVREIYINFASGLFNDEWLKIFIDTEGFSRVEKVFISSGTDLVDAELIEAFCFFLNEKKSLSKLILNLLKCNISMKSLTTCLQYVKDAKKLLYASVTTKKVSLVDNKMKKNGSHVIKDLMV